MPTHLMLKGLSLTTAELAADLAETLQNEKPVIIEVRDSQLTPSVIEQVQATRVGLIIQTSAVTMDEFQHALSLAGQTNARTINVRQDDTHKDSVAGLIRQFMEAATTSGRTVVLEIAPDANSTQDNITRNLLTSLPDLNLTINTDALINSKTNASSAELIAERLSPLFSHTEMIRCSSQQSLELQKKLWTDVMRSWRRRKPAGSTFTFLLDSDIESTGSIWAIAQAAWKDSAR